MHRIKLVLEYDGTNFFGFQVQPNKRTVQAEVELALFKLFSKKIKIFACGRTDAGVHALCQVVHFDLDDSKIKSADIKNLKNDGQKSLVSAITKNPKEFPALMLMFELNKLLPLDISVSDAKKVSADFDARFSSTEKTYVLKFYMSRFERALFANRSLRINDNLDINAMREGAQYFVGKHDFTSFVARKSGKTDFVREIYFADILKVGDSEFEFKITGNGFLYNMVRILFGTLLLVGSGQIKPQDIKNIINSKNRALAGKTVPPHGLYLFDVKY